ncbi:MAG: hypothetical protein HLUCCA04_03500 [Oceanicaulis sp. HLUCCA04]|nr:MAG: hypothetical protein HLUCCA04_03500 [Oceanicaulis sp. HLUCCA04]
MGIILALVAVILFIVGITFSMIRAGIDNSPKHQVKAKAEYQKKKREQNWDENSGPSESEFVADYLDKKRPGFWMSHGLVVIAILLIVTSCFVPAG